jgi:hypothetical protein
MLYHFNGHASQPRHIKRRLELMPESGVATRRTWIASSCVIRFAKWSWLPF